jgi:GTPase
MSDPTTPPTPAVPPAKGPMISPSIVQPANPRCGFIAIIGAPNAGKSTLVNTMVGTKVTIVSHKVQTTRMPIRGLAMVGDSQLVFIDTPGIFKPRRRLDRAMVQAAWGGAKDADVVLFLFDAQKDIDAATKAMVQKLSETKVKTLLGLNKIDAIKKEKLFSLATGFNNIHAFDRTFMISATDGRGVDDLKQYLGKLVPAGDWHYPPEDVSDLPLRLLAAEITREKVFDRLHQELPYAATVETTGWKDMGKKGIRVEQTIFVAREGQRAIVLGDGGTTIKQLSMASRKELCAITEREVHLFLHVKVQESWADDPQRYRDLGLEYPTD